MQERPLGQWETLSAHNISYVNPMYKVSPTIRIPSDLEFDLAGSNLMV